MWPASSATSPVNGPSRPLQSSVQLLPICTHYTNIQDKAILLNRTHFYASSRIPLSFDRVYLRFAIYIAPLLLFLYQIQGVLQAIRCQTSPAWSEMQYGALGRQLDTDFAGEGGYLWQASSALLFWETTEDSCRAANMLPLDDESTRLSGSLSILWPLFLSLGMSQFVETLSCHLRAFACFC
jgi:hypothetical protein